jgi:hypothetical protein
VTMPRTRLKPPPYFLGSRVTVVAGPPCSGKTSYVRGHAGPGDLVVDYDALAVALGSGDSHDHPATLRPFILNARDAVIDRLSRFSDVPHAWVIYGAPTLAERHAIVGADVVVLAVDAAECKRRAVEAGRPERWAGLVDQWWLAYQPHPRDHVVTTAMQCNA